MNEKDLVSLSAQRFRARRRRFLLVGVAALAAVAAAMGVSFTADTGTADVSVTAGTSSSLVFPVASGAALPSGTAAMTWGTAAPTTNGTAAAALKHGTKAFNPTATTAQITTTPAGIFLPAWKPVAGAAGSIPAAFGTPGAAVPNDYRGPGDLFVIDGRTASAGGAASITVTVYITNLANLQAAYSSFAWPIRLYFADGTTAPITQGSWSAVTNGNPAGVTFDSTKMFLTNTGGYVSYYLPTGTNHFYEIAVDTGGSYYTVSTATPANLSPTFFVTAQAT